MCGICGELSFGSQPPDVAGVSRMTERLAHRGPDGARVVDFGPLVVGHLRLAILDTSSAGHQPMASADGRYHLIHNGEVYNFLELADELRALGHRFSTQTDTEVILEAYARWGPACVERFNGIWAFALWDAEAGELFLSRDRLGVKPLFIAEAAGRLAFASEIKALLTLDWVGNEADGGIVRDFLLREIVDHTERTFFRDIRRLPAAHNLVVSRSGTRQWRYWQPASLATDASIAGEPADSDRVAGIRALLVEAVSLQLRSDVPIGSCLSGGLDSSSIVTIADALRRGTLGSGGVVKHERDRHPQLAFFASFDEPAIDERRYVADVVAQTGIELRTTSPTSDEFLASLDAVVNAQDEPFLSTSILAQYHVMRIAHEAGVKVLLDGQGADELFGGYPTYRGPRYAGVPLGSWPRVAAGVASGRLPVSPLALTFSALSRGSRRPWWARPARALAASVGPAATGGGVPTTVAIRGTLLARVLWRDIATTHLPGLLRYEDRNSMAFGIEARVPFLDHRLVEAALLLPDRLKIAGAERKAGLRQAVADLVPLSVAHRTDKIGFETPEASWLRAGWPALTGLRANAGSEARALLKHGTVGRALDAWAAGRLSRDVVWRVLSLELWTRSAE
jgi:asparagine synthase (glutamine-hydrolysing)